jgi:hypothetical protein
MATGLNEEFTIYAAWQKPLSHLVISHRIQLSAEKCSSLYYTLVFALQNSCRYLPGYYSGTVLQLRPKG